MNKIILYCIATLCTHFSYADDALRKALEGNFATSVLLSDSEAITFGFQSFDPNTYVDIDDNLGGAESLELRKQISIYSLPLSFSLPSLRIGTTNTLEQDFTFVGSYYTVKRDIDVTGVEGDPQDSVKDEIYTLSAKYLNRYQLDKQWSIGTGIKANTMYFENSYTYRNSATSEIQDLIDGVLVNTSAWAFVVEPSLDLYFDEKHRWGRWEYYSGLKYFYGVGWGEANYGDIGNPEGWYWINGVKSFFDVTRWGNEDQTVYSSFKRIDIGADLEVPMGTDHYYELSVGWLTSSPYLSEYIENIGVGLNFNYGSSLKGGSIVLLFNQE